MIEDSLPGMTKKDGAPARSLSELPASHPLAILKYSRTPKELLAEFSYMTLNAEGAHQMLGEFKQKHPQVAQFIKRVVKEEMLTPLSDSTETV